MTFHDCKGILLPLYAFDGTEEFECMETRVGVKTTYITPTYPIDFYKIASMWTPLTSHGNTGILLTLYALDGSEEFECVEAC